MSHIALQRVLVRMLYDPALVAAVRRDPAQALAGLPLSAQERRWLAAADPRAFATDTLRRGRTLHALVEEYPATVARLRATGRTDAVDLEAFFGSPCFHRAVQGRGSLGLAFGAFLGALAGDDQAGAGLAALERALAAVRRGRAAPWASDGGRPARLPGRVGVVEAPEGTLAAYERLRAAVAGAAVEPVAALLGVASEHILLIGDASGGAELSFISAPLYRLLAAAADGTSLDALVAVAREEGATDDEAAELIEELVGDGLLERRQPA